MKKRPSLISTRLAEHCFMRYAVLLHLASVLLSPFCFSQDAIRGPDSSRCTWTADNALVTKGFVTVKGQGGLAEVRIEKKDAGDASTFQWQEMTNGDIMLLSLYNHRYLNVDPRARSLCSADARGARPDHQGGACFRWKFVNN